MRFVTPPRKVTGARVLGMAREDRDKLFARRFNEKFFIGKGEQDFGFFEFVKARAGHGTPHSFRIASSTNAWKPDAVDLEVTGRRATMAVPEAYLRLHRDNAVYVVDTDFPLETITQPKQPVGEMSLADESIRLQDAFGVLLAQINPFLEYPCAAICEAGRRLAIRKVRRDLQSLNRKMCGEAFTWQDLQESQGAGLLDELIAGRSRLLELKDGGTRYIRLIINFCEKGNAAAEGIIRSLQAQYKHVIERHSISKPPGTGDYPLYRF